MMSRLLLLMTVLLGCSVPAWADPITIQWDATADARRANFYVQRCALAAGTTTCVPQADAPNMPLPTTARSYTDTSGYCWSVAPADRQGRRGLLAQTTDGQTVVCAAGLQRLPAVGPITIQPTTTSLRLAWQPPVFTPDTVPASALTAYWVWWRPEPLPQGMDWAQAAVLGKEVTTWNHTTAWNGNNCYQIRALYGTLGYVDNATTCLSWTAPPLAAPTNLRAVVTTPATRKAVRARHHK